MCVINVIDNNVYPSKEIIEKMSNENPHGNSIIYFDKLISKIVYHKAISLKKLNNILDYCKKNQFKVILHFRIASVGSAKNKSLNHPFEIINGNQFQLFNKTNNDVLIHNGTLNMKELNEIALKIMLNDKKAKYPLGELSDTKLLSWILSHIDYSILNMMLVGNKFAIMDGNNGNITTFGNFTKVKDNSNMILCSNDYFDNNIDLFSNTPEYDIYYDKYEQKELSRLREKYKDVLTIDDFNDYLDLGYNIYDLEDIIENELGYLKDGQYYEQY